MPNQPITPRCHIPWQEMNIDADGNVTPCCNWLSHLNTKNPYCGNIKTQSLMEIWNGEVYQNLRKYMAVGDYEKSGCANCTIILRGEKSRLRFDPDVANELTETEDDGELTPYARNMKILGEEIAVGATILEATPTVLSVVPSYSCNLRCLHCYQEPVRTKDLNRPSLLEEIRALVPTLSLINCGGGEPLILPIWRDFLEHLDLHENPYLTFGTCTNATVLSDRALKAIDQFKNLHLGVSVDAGSPDVYEHVRVNGSFETVNSNIDKLLELVRRRPSSQLSVSMSVMRDNFGDISNFMNFANCKGVTFSLSPVISMPPDQSITCFNDAERELPRWREVLDRAIAMVDALDLSAITGDESSLRLNYRNQIDFVCNMIPWDLSRQRTHHVEGEVFSELLEKYTSVSKPNVDHLLLFWPNEGGNPSVARYHSKIVDGRFSVWLPEGSYFLGVVPRFGWPVHDLDWLIDVTSDGRFARRSKGRYLEGAMRYVTAISSGDLSPYAAEYAFEPNTNAWNSAHSGAAVAGTAFIGAAFSSAIKVTALQVRWVLRYATPSRIALQFSDDGHAWQTSAEFRVPQATKNDPFWYDDFDAPDHGEHRYWRILALTPTSGNSSFAVAELDFRDHARSRARRSAPVRLLGRTIRAIAPNAVPAARRLQARLNPARGLRPQQRRILWQALKPRGRLRSRDSNTIVMLAISNLHIDPRVLREAQALASSGFAVKIIYADTDRPYSTEQPLDWGPGITFRALPTQAASFSSQFPWLLGELLFEAACEESPLAFHCHDLSTAIVGLAAARRVGALCVCDFHEWFSENVSWDAEKQAYLPHPRGQKSAYRWAEKLCLLKADAVITVCDSIADELAAMVSVHRNINLIRNIPALDAQPTRDYPPLKAQLGLSDQKFVLLWQGGTGPTRLIEPIIEALAHAPQAVFVIRGPSLDLFGDGYRSVAERCGVADRLILLPPVPSPDVVAAARGADAGIWTLPNLSKNFYYALPNKIFEYMAAGLPVLAANFPEARKMVEDNGVGFCFDPYDPKSIAIQINRLINEQGLATRIRHEIPRVLTNIAADREWHKLVALYKRLGESGRPADRFAARSSARIGPPVA